MLLLQAGHGAAVAVAVAVVIGLLLGWWWRHRCPRHLNHAGRGREGERGNSDAVAKRNEEGPGLRCLHLWQGWPPASPAKAPILAGRADPAGVRLHRQGLDADFHRLKDGNWIRLPHAGRVGVNPAPVVQPAAPEPPQLTSVMDSGLMRLDRAAERLGMTVAALTNRLTPGSIAKQGPLERNGYRVVREGRGLVRLTPC